MLNCHIGVYLFIYNGTMPEQVRSTLSLATTKSVGHKRWCTDGADLYTVNCFRRFLL